MVYWKVVPPSVMVTARSMSASAGTWAVALLFSGTLSPPSAPTTTVLTMALVPADQALATVTV